MFWHRGPEHFPHFHKGRQLLDFLSLCPVAAPLGGLESGKKATSGGRLHRGLKGEQSFQTKARGRQARRSRRLLVKPASAGGHSRAPPVPAPCWGQLAGEGFPGRSRGALRPPPPSPATVPAWPGGRSAPGTHPAGGGTDGQGEWRQPCPR